MIYSSCLKFQINNREPQTLKVKDFDWAEALNLNPETTLNALK